MSAFTFDPMSSDIVDPPYSPTRPSSDCRSEHWPKHKEDCEAIFPGKIELSDVIGAEAHSPEETSKPWANYAATDVINFSRQTEGVGFDGQLNILLSGGTSIPYGHF
ncbi:hypothetical protein E4U54_001527 [Claviceps lovelessii]|nr:hypothetical protein E4U54_001527 [Claviceps lovelessii]